MEKTLGRRIFDRYIQLYTSDYCFPNGAKHKIDWRKYNEFKKVDIKYSWSLKDYQLEALWHVAEHDWWLIEAATWSWKSHILIGITEYYKTRTLIVCPTKKLVKEMVDKFKEFTDYEPWTYYSDWKNIKDITITTHTSFAQDIETNWNLKWFNVVCVDEADDKLSKKMIDALCKCDCDILVWMSWTPNRQELNLDDMQLIFWPYIKVWDYQVLPDKITHYVYRRDRDESDCIDYTNWHTQRESIIYNKNRFDTVIDTIRTITEKSFLSLILLDRIEEVEKYSIEFPDAAVITWNTKVKDDEVLITKLKKEWWIIIWSIKKMYRWIDIPECDNVVIASPIKFENTVIQSVWRALRAFEWKWEVSINIINDNVLNRQRYEQTKSCIENYWITPEVIYIQNINKWEKNSPWLTLQSETS